MPSVKTPKGASSTITNLFMAGVFLSLVGALLAVYQHPETSVNGLGIATKSGSDGGYFFGLLLAGVGGTMLWVAVIAYGVMLGNRASRE